MAQNARNEGPPNVPDETRTGTSWRPVDVQRIVAGLMDGTYRSVQPTVLRRADGQALLYPGKVNGIHAESGAGKTMVALHAAAQELADGHGVVYLDYEDSPVDVLARLLALGVRPEHLDRHFMYVHPDERFETAATQFSVLIKELKPTLIVIDSTGESIAAEGRQPNADEDVSAWFRELPKQLAKSGAAVLLIDHMPKASDRDLWPIGSQRKRAAIDGAQYLLETKKAFSKETAGIAVLKCAKDRHGNFTQGEKVALVQVTPSAARIHVSLEREMSHANRGAEHAMLALARSLSEVLASATGPMTYNQVSKLVSGNRDRKRDAMNYLIRAGFVALEAGSRGAQMHRHIRPFDEPEGSGTVGAQIVPETTVHRSCSLSGGTVNSDFTVPEEQWGSSGERSSSEELNGAATGALVSIGDQA